MQARELKRLGATRIFAVRRRDGRWFQERTMVIGFHWQTSGVAWCRSQRLSSKWPRSLAEGVARQVGGEVVEVVQGPGQLPQGRAGCRRGRKRPLGYVQTGGFLHLPARLERARVE